MNKRRRYKAKRRRLGQRWLHRLRSMMRFIELAEFKVEPWQRDLMDAIISGRRLYVGGLRGGRRAALQMGIDWARGRDWSVETYPQQVNTGALRGLSHN